MQSDSRYNIDRNTFSLIINSVEPSDADDTYQCFLSVVDPHSDLPIYLQTGVVRITLMVNGKRLMIIMVLTVVLWYYLHAECIPLWSEWFSLATLLMVHVQ